MAHSERFISMEEWERRLQRVKVEKQDMNKLVMNFLVTEGLVEAVKKFRVESGTNHTDLATVNDRMAVKRAVALGNVEFAIVGVFDMDPEILRKNPEVLFKLYQQLFIELARNDNKRKAMKFAREIFFPISLQNHDFREQYRMTLRLLETNSVEESPARHLLTLTQRFKTARALNEAILISQTNEKEAKLNTILKMLEWVYRELEHILQ